MWTFHPDPLLSIFIPWVFVFCFKIFLGCECIHLSFYGPVFTWGKEYWQYHPFLVPNLSGTTFDLVYQKNLSGVDVLRMPLLRLLFSANIELFWIWKHHIVLFEFAFPSTPDIMNSINQVSDIEPALYTCDQAILHDVLFLFYFLHILGFYSLFFP